jgi:hypothetical protein
LLFLNKFKKKSITIVGQFHKNLYRVKLQSWADLKGLGQFAYFISQTPPMSEDRARALTSFDGLALRDRWALFQLWTNTARRELVAKIQHSQQEYGNCVRRLAELQSLGDVEIMKKSKVY